MVLHCTLASRRRLSRAWCTRSSERKGTPPRARIFTVTNRIYRTCVADSAFGLDFCWFFWYSNQALRSGGNAPSNSFHLEPSADWRGSTFEMRLTSTGIDIVQDGSVKYTWSATITYPIYVTIDFGESTGTKFENLRYIYQ